MANYGEDSLLQEVREDVKTIQKEMACIKTDIALIRQSLTIKQEDKKIRASIVVALIGLFSGMGGALLTALLRG